MIKQMSIEIELYEEQRRKMRRSSFFKGSITTLIIISFITLVWNRDFISSPHIAMYEVFGEIHDDQARETLLKKIAINEDVFGLIVKINSPGGTVVGAESLYDSLKKISDKKPVVVVIGEVGASAAYLAALAGDQLFARGNSLVGSIGVIVQYPDLSKLGELLGVSMQVVKSGEVKGGTNFFEPMSKNVIKNQELLVNDSFHWFKNLVSEKRKLVGEELDKVSQGQLFTGRMALDLGLIDAIGSSDDAILYFQNHGEQFKDLSIKDWTLDKNSTSIWKMFLGFDNPISTNNKIKFLRSPMLFSIAS